MAKLRLSYPISKPFSRAVTVGLILAYIFGFAGLFAWNFLTSAKAERCLSRASPVYEGPDQCEKTPVTFSTTYYTQPIRTEADYSSSNAVGSIGTYPWVPLGFGRENATTNGAIDYTILSLPWRSQALQCAMYSQDLLLDLSSENSVISACYYCGPEVRTLCTSVDSVRSQVPESTISSYTNILNQFVTLSGLAHAISDSAISGATVQSVRVRTQRVLDGVAIGVLPFNTSDFTVSLGSSIGPVPIDANSTRAGVASLVQFATTLASIVEESTERDLQPATSDGRSAQYRTLQVSYLCRTCSKVYKPILEIVALLITGIFGVLSPAFGLAKILAEWMFADSEPTHPASTHYDPLQHSYFATTPGNIQSKPSSPVAGLPPMAQIPYQAGPQWGQQNAPYGHFGGGSVYSHP